jgi:hypothetical protein
VNAVEPQLAGKVSNLRRSQRVYVSVEVVVGFERALEKLPPEQAKTVIVNAHGALILIRTPVTIGELLTVRNVRTEEQLSCKVVDLAANSESGVMEVGVEFLEPAPKFWRVAFPPANWTPRCAEAKGHRPPTASQPVVAKEK